MERIQIPKGTFDILPYGEDEPWQLTSLWRYAEEIIRKTAADYGFSEIRTPVLERTELFARGVGETSDIVMKEMFTFQDRGGRSLSLRPEGTAAVMRAYVEHNFSNLGPVHKLFYLAPMFRYERPQSGRYRQHHQFGVEAIGVASPAQDAEVIDLLYETYRRLGLKDLSVQLNSVGDVASRASFRAALQAYLRPFFNELSEDSKNRFERNPLRILDSKDPKDKEILTDAPSILKFLTPQAQEHFDQLRAILDSLNVPYRVNDRIVRGLDYYDKTVFEVTANVLGAQNSVGAGGRYDGLIADFGGPDAPGVGFGTGIERVLQTLIQQKAKLPEKKGPFIFFLALGDEAKRLIFPVAARLRRQEIPVEVDLHAKKIQAGLQNAVGCSAQFCVLIGSDELEKRIAQVKNLETRCQEEVPFDRLEQVLEDCWRKK